MAVWWELSDFRDPPKISTSKAVLLWMGSERLFDVGEVAAAVEEGNDLLGLAVGRVEDLAFDAL